MKTGSFFIDDKPPKKFIALYTDGSGGNVFLKIDASNSMTDTDQYLDANGDLNDYEHFLDSNYSFWIELPETFSLWQERQPYE